METDQSSFASPQELPPADSNKVQAKHFAEILDNALDGAEPLVANSKLPHPMVIDFLIAIGLLLAMTGFFLGLVRMYIAHSAEQNISQGNYRAAISLLEGVPLTNFLVTPGTDINELLYKALYLDAIQKLDTYSEDQSAIQELEKIEPGSNFFDLAQAVLKEHFKPASLTLQGSTTQEEHLK